MKKFTCYPDEGLEVTLGSKINLTVSGKAPGMLMYGIKGDDNDYQMSDVLTLCSDYNDQNYLAEDKMEALPENITATVREIESVFGVHTLVVSIDELEEN